MSSLAGSRAGSKSRRSGNASSGQAPWRSHGRGIRCPGCADAQQVEERALHAPGDGKEPGKIGVRGRGVLHQELDHGEAGLHRVGRVDGVLVLVVGKVAVVRPPQRHEAPATLARQARSLRPLPLADGCKRGRGVAGKRLPVEIQAGNSHG